MDERGRRNIDRPHPWRRHGRTAFTVTGTLLLMLLATAIGRPDHLSSQQQSPEVTPTPAPNARKPIIPMDAVALRRIVMATPHPSPIPEDTEKCRNMLNCLKPKE